MRSPALSSALYQILWYYLFLQEYQCQYCAGFRTWSLQFSYYNFWSKGSPCGKSIKQILKLHKIIRKHYRNGGTTTDVDDSKCSNIGLRILTINQSSNR